MQARTTDFTQGKIVPQIVAFTIPILFSELLQNLYQSADAFVIGNFAGKTALAAISVCDPIANLLIGFFTGMSIGASVVVARIFGSGDKKRMTGAASDTVSFSILLGIAFSVVGVACAPSLLRLAAVPTDVLDEAIAYLRIYLGGLVFSVSYNVCAGVLRAAGNARAPFIILVATSCINIALDFVLVVIIPLGVVGAAAATVIAQGISVVIAIYVIKRIDGDFRISFRLIGKNAHVIREFIRIGVPSGLQASLISLSKVILMRYVSAFGAPALAGVGIAHRVDKFVSMNCNAFGTAITTYVSQNIGASKFDRAKKGIRVCLLLSLAITITVGLLAYRFADSCVAVFTSDADVIQIGVDMMRVLTPFYFLLSIRQIQLGILRSIGKVKAPMLLSLLGMLVIRLIYLSIFMSISPNIRYIYYSFPIAWVSTVIFTFLYQLYLKRKNGAILSAPLSLDSIPSD